MREAGGAEHEGGESMFRVGVPAHRGAHGRISCEPAQGEGPRRGATKRTARGHYRGRGYATGSRPRALEEEP
jgi:hypothetical protein